MKVEDIMKNLIKYINDAIFGPEVVYKLANGQRVLVDYDNYGYVRPRVRHSLMVYKQPKQVFSGIRIAS